MYCEIVSIERVNFKFGLSYAVEASGQRATAGVLLFQQQKNIPEKQQISYSLCLWQFFKMSSGIGVKGTMGRCYPFYADLRKCVVSQCHVGKLIPWRFPTVRSHSCILLCDRQAKKTVDSPPAMCSSENVDYFECLHGFKEKARILQVAAERQRREKLGESFEIKN